MLIGLEGENEYFTGDGTTKNLLPNSTERGVMETFTYDKNPDTLDNMQAKCSLKLVATKPV